MSSKRGCKVLTTHHEAASRSEVEKLRQELSQLRKAAGIPEPVKPEHHPREVYGSATLVESMEKLHTVLDKLVKLFENANREIYDEYAKGLRDTDAKLEQVIAQNEKLARGVVALADMMKQPRPAPRLTAPTAPTPAPVEQEDDIPPPPRFVPPAQPLPPGVRQDMLDEESFMRQPVTQMNTLQNAQQVPAEPPMVTMAAIPPMAPPPQAPPNAAPPPLPSLGQESRVSNSWPSTPAQPISPGLEGIPPPPPAPQFNQRRSILDKFAFK